MESLLPCLQDKDARINKKKSVSGKARASEKFLRLQRRKRDCGNACAVLLASSTTAAREHAGAGPLDRDERQLHCLLDTDEDNGQALATLMRIHVGDSAERDSRQDGKRGIVPGHRWR